MPYIYSTLANDNNYNVYLPTPQGGAINNIERKILVKGGAGISNKHLVTPMGIATYISDEDLEFLSKDEVFQTHLKFGSVRVGTTKKPQQPEVFVADMNPRDKSAPIVPEDTLESDKVKPVGMTKKESK